jgi:cytoskeletal protein RodZ
MKSKKIILGLIVAVLLIGGVSIWRLSSDKSQTNDNEISEATDTDDNSGKDSKAEDSSNPAESKDTSSSTNEAPKDSENKSNTQETVANNKFSGKDAVVNIIKYFVGEDKVKSQHITSITLDGQAIKREENNNTFYCDSQELNDNTKTGLIIKLDSYDESKNSYKYSIEDYSAIVNGKDASMGSGTVSGDGSVTED